MQSQHCQMRVRQAMNLIPDTAINSLEPGSLTISVEHDSTLNEALAAIEKAGYSLGQVEVISTSEHVDETFEFKTDINCGHCLSKVSEVLNSAEGICHWDVKTQNEDHILSVHSKGITRQEIIHSVKNAGFNIESINV